MRSREKSKSPPSFAKDAKEGWGNQLRSRRPNFLVSFNRLRERPIFSQALACFPTHCTVITFTEFTDLF